MATHTDDLNIRAVHPLISPSVLQEDLPLLKEVSKTVLRGRMDVANILSGKDSRLLVIVGPCSIHDTEAGLEYANRLSSLAEKYRDSLCIVLRVYFEKPRTRLGWKGLINDPDLDGSYHINKGLHLAREFLINVASLGLPSATEFLDTTFGQYFADLISVGAIGARTTESQIHRELASGLSMPVGFKNRTDGNITVAIDALVASSQSHSFPSLTKDGAPAIMETEGNQNSFLILRGGSSGPNYSQEDIERASAQLQKSGVKTAIVVDCSHGNSGKDYRNQPRVVNAISEQIKNGSTSIKGLMIESHLKEGNQPINAREKLEYGKSITDACIGWNTTEGVLELLAESSNLRLIQS